MLQVPTSLLTGDDQVLSRDYVVNSRRSSDALKEAYKGQSEGWTSSYHNQFVRFESMPLSSLNVSAGLLASCSMWLRLYGYMESGYLETTRKSAV